ncbi:MAG: chitobiase/beta-hexosaminidase C-terminal domain-containing protein, partial [Actinomycetota bacterium]|nr:chitobiase/beta-hexosaminidase C-terminal domain-containing protein [Actinomycetota bacterium]
GGGALTVNGTVASGGGSSSYSSSGSFTIGTRTDYTETQTASESGLASSTLVRTSAGYSSADVCGAFASPTTIVGSPNQSGLTTGCYRYTLTGTDNVGNTVSIQTTVKVDTSAPSNPTLSISNSTGGTYYPGAGTQVFFKPSAASGGFDLTASSTDPDTGISGYTFPTGGAMGTNWSVSGAGATRSYSFTPTAGEPGAKSVSASNNAGASASSVFTVTADSTAPSTTIQCNGAACLNGTYYTSPPVAVTLSANDGAGSGLQKIRYTTNGTDPTPVNGTDYTGAISINSTTTVKFRAYDNLGNEEAVGSQQVLIDSTPPNLSLTLTENPASGAQHVSGTTVFYRPGAGGGTFRVTATADDPQSGVASVAFPSIANVTGGSTQTSSPYREDYTWSAATTDAAAHNVVATNGSAATTSVPFTLAQDSAAPTGQSITLTGASTPYYGSASVSFTLGDGSDGSGSGLDTSSRTVTRESAPLTGDSCGVFTAAGTATSPDTSVSNGNCYRYTFTIADNVGNVSSPVTATAKVDTQAPTVSLSAPTELTGAGNQYYDGASKTQFFRPAGSGSFRLNATASDSETAVTSVSFPNISALSGWSGSTGGTDTTSPYSSPADYTWSSGAVAPGARTVSGSDKAANSSSDTVTVAADSAAPTGQALTLTGANAPYYSAASVTFSLADGSDGTGSGLDTATRNVTRETGDLAAGSCSNFVADSGSFSSPDTSVSTGHCYRYTFTISDNVGNVSTAVTATAKVDTDAPTVSATAPTELTGAGNQYYDAASKTQYFRPAGSGSFSLHATASDPQSAVAQVAFPNVSAVSGWAGSIGGVDSSSPYTSPNDYTWSSGATAPGARTITATNGAGVDGTATITLAADSTAPSGQTLTLTGANAPYYGSASVSFTSGDGTDSGSGLDSSSRTISRESATLTSDACGSFSSDAGNYTSPDTSVTTGRCYRYTLTISDNVGSTSTPVTATAKVDTDNPSVNLTDPGTPVSGTVGLNATASDPSTTVQQVVFERAPAGSSTWTTIGTDTTSPYTASWDTTSLSDGLYDLRAVATDKVNHTSTSLVANRRVDNTPPNTTIDSSPPSPSGNTTPTFTFSSNETGSTFECRVDGGGWTSCSSPLTISPALSQGTHTFDVRAIDQAGNIDPTPASYTWIIDTAPPTVTITAPTTYVNSSDPNNYTVTASTPDTDVTRVDFFECSDASTACATGSWVQFGTDSSSPYAATWSTPAFDGLKAIRALAVDIATNTGQHVRTITIDRTAPTGVTVTYPNGYVVGSYSVATSNGPDSDVNPATGSLQRQTGDLANNTCSSYGGWVAATSPDTLASGKCAKYRYSVSDNAGNLAVATSANEAKSDTVAPTSSQADPGANMRQTVSLSASATDTGGSGVDSVAFQRRPAGGGSWTTIAADSSAPYSVSFDTTAVADGLYDFRSVATDLAANTEASPVVLSSKRIDNTAPSATMLSPGNPVGGLVTLTSNTSDTGGSGIATVGYERAPNGGSFNSQPAAWDTTLAPDGLYDLRVVATDAAGNTTTSTAVTTRVDNTPPALTFSSPAGGTVVSGTVNLVGSASDASPASPPVTFAYKLASDPPSAYTATGASWNTATLPAGDGLYDLRARATDDASNTASVENKNIRVDNAPPTVSITAPPAAINGSLPSPTTFAANASDPGGSGVTQVQFFECSDQSNNCATGVWNPLGTVPAPGPYNVSWSIPAADGNHALAAVATDNAGHPATAIRNVSVDRTAPNTTILTKPSDPSSVAVPSFTFTSSEPGSTFECRIDGGAFVPCTSPHNVAGLTDNAHTFDVRATDPAGNTDATPDSWTWHRDTNNPTGTLNSPGANIRQTATLTSTETDPPANGYASGLQSVTYEYSADGTTWAPIGTLNSAPFDTLLWNTTGVADGVYQLRIVVRDVAGNTTTSSTVPNVRIDNTPPTTSQNDPGQYLRATKTLTGSAADSGSGIDHVDFQRALTGGGSWTTIGTDSTPADGFQVSFDTTTVSDGHYDLRTVAYDVAGNQ